ncbi:MAG: metallophosphoesterase family protein [Balneolaceae bacterium]
MKNQIVAIGDIHGCAKTLKDLWERLESYKEFTHVFVGDYIDRGPDSKGVIDFLLKVQQDRECIFLRGNHEQMLLNSIYYQKLDLWIMNGGRETLNSYNDAQIAEDLPDEHIEFFKNTLIYYETDDYFFVHAGAPPYQTIQKSKQDPDSETYFLWGRDHLNALEVVWEKTIIFGHTPRAFPIRKPKMIGIDTGCVYNDLGMGKLTALILPDETFIEQKTSDELR